MHTGKRSGVMFDFILLFDLSVAGAADKLRFSCGRFLTPVMKAITLSGNMGMIFVVSAFIMLFFKKTRRFGVAALIAIALGFLFTNVILKHVIARERPFENVSSKFYTYWKAAGALNESGYSFPSGHTTAATAFGVSLFLHTKKRCSWLFLAIPAVMGFTRIYFVVHYASDILGGFIAGSAAAVIAYFIVAAAKRLICSDGSGT